MIQYNSCTPTYIQFFFFVRHYVIPNITADESRRDVGGRMATLQPSLSSKHTRVLQTICVMRIRQSVRVLQLPTHAGYIIFLPSTLLASRDPKSP